MGCVWVVGGTRKTHANQISLHTARFQGLFRELLVRRRRGVDHQCLRVTCTPHQKLIGARSDGRMIREGRRTDIREVTRQFEEVDDLARLCCVALHPEIQHASECTGPQRGEGELVRGMRREPEVRDPSDMRAGKEVSEGGLVSQRVRWRSERGDGIGRGVSMMERQQRRGGDRLRVKTM